MFFYIHIPFCRQRCLYCKFALTPKFDEMKIRVYIDAVKKEISWFFTLNQNVLIETIYFGGWTPSILTDEQIIEILEIFYVQKGFVATSEITMESNPEDITEVYLKALTKCWINRLSLGIQTLNEYSLWMIGRANSNQSIFNALECINRSTFVNISIDLIAGLPGTMPWQIRADLTEIFAHITPKHVSIYMLENESYPMDWKEHLPSEQKVVTEYLSWVQWLESKGFHRYELSNFAQSGYESKHNQSYWNHSSYRGFWLSAASFLGGQRSMNSASFNGYYRWEIKKDEICTEESLRIERIMFGFRTNGVSLVDIGEVEALGRFISEKLLEVRENKVFPTSTWIFLIDHIIGELI
jgi:oxygen-independent coproporphyrinogen-3 oxidase